VARDLRKAALVATVVVLCGCAAPAATPGTPVDPGPVRPAAAGAALVAEGQALGQPMVLDRIPDGLVLQELHADVSDLSGGFESPRAALYGDPALADTLDGPVLLVGTSSGSAMIGGPPAAPPGDREVDLGDRDGWVVHDADRTWVGVVDPDSEDYVQFVVGRGLDEDALIAAAKGADFSTATATLAPDAVPDGLAPLLAGNPSDGPFAWPAGERFTLAGEEGTVVVSAVRAEPRLTTLWGLWTDDAAGTVIRGEPGSLGDMHGIKLGDEARGYVWAENGMVLSVIGLYGGERFIDAVLRDLRIGTAADLEVMRRGGIDRVPTAEDVGCREGTPIVTGVDGDLRWALGVEPEPKRAHTGAWSTCHWVNTLEAPTGGYGSWDLPPRGQIGLTGLELGQEVTNPGTVDRLVGGVAPPGTARVTVHIDGRIVDAVLAGPGPRPGEKLFGTYLRGLPSSVTGTPVVATAYDATGAVLATS
jgi:hypothetical protein